MELVVRKQIVKFAPKGTASFYDDVKHRVNEYFQSNNIPEHYNAAMVVKTIAMISMYFVPYFAIVTGLVHFSLLLFYASWLVMGLGIVGIGTSVMHDSNHGAYTTNKTVNNLLGSLLNILGGYAENWKYEEDSEEE